MSILALDLDGCLADFSSTFAAVARDLGYDVPLGHQAQSWYWSEVLSREEHSRVWDAAIAQENLWLNVAPYHDAKELIQSLYDHTLYFVTSRSPSAGHPVALQCQMWLDRVTGLGFFGNVIVVTRPEYKPRVLQAIGAHYALDDKVETVEQMRAKVPACQSYLLTRPWNRKIVSTAPRVASLGEWAQIVRAA